MEREREIRGKENEEKDKENKQRRKRSVGVGGVEWLMEDDMKKERKMTSRRQEGEELNLKLNFYSISEGPKIFISIIISFFLNY